MSPSASSPLSRRARHRTAPAGSPSAATGGSGWSRRISGRLGATRWEAAVDFLAAVLVACGSTLWAAGSALGGAGLDDYDWEQLGGGGLAQLDLASGAVLASARFGDDLAWGSGGVAAGRGGRRALWRGPPRRAARAALPVQPVTTRLTGELAPHPLGIAHAAVVGDQLVVGFNRGGYQLHTVPLRTISRTRPGSSGP